MTIRDSRGGGSITWNLGCSGSSGTVNIAGGSVKKVSGINPYYDDETGAEGQYTINVTGGSEHSGYWDVSGGTWHISAGTFGEVVFVDPNAQTQNAVISGGIFEKISTISSRGSSFEVPLSALLAGGCAFYSQNADSSAYDMCENAASTTVLNKVTVKSHTHIMGENGACTECGKSWGHIDGNINYDSGICETCGKQLEAAVWYKDGAVVGFESFLSALDSVPHNMTEEVTVVLLQNYELNSEYFLDCACLFSKHSVK